MIELTSRAPGDRGEEEMVDLFSIDGVVYQMPAAPRANIALQYLVDLKDQGPMLAEMRLMEALVGEEGYRALAGFPDLDRESMRAITRDAAMRTLGALEVHEGNGEGG